MPFVKIVDTAFKPFTDGRGHSVQVAGVLGGCEQHPCALGHVCRYTNYSLSCAPCASGTVGIDGIRCSLCQMFKDICSQAYMLSKANGNWHSVA